jgi:hypothetical protein
MAIPGLLDGGEVTQEASCWREGQTVGANANTLNYLKTTLRSMCLYPLCPIFNTSVHLKCGLREDAELKTGTCTVNNAGEVLARRTE